MLRSVVLTRVIKYLIKVSIDYQQIPKKHQIFVKHCSIILNVNLLFPTTKIFSFAQIIDCFKRDFKVRYEVCKIFSLFILFKKLLKYFAFLNIVHVEMTFSPIFPPSMFIF